MNMPTVFVDKNFFRVNFDNITVWFSYKTPIAFKIGNNERIIHKNIWSNTTGKHLNMIDNNLKARVGAEEFERLWNEHMKCV